MGNFLRRLLPQRVCCCLKFEVGLKLVLIVTMLVRFTAMVLGCCYGPYLYLVLPLGGLYVAFDGLIIYAVTASISAINKEDQVREEGGDDRNGGGGTTWYKDPPEEDEVDSSQLDCQFPALKLWISGWLIMNLVAVCGLGVAIGLFADLGTWSMTHEPIHIALFVIIIFLVALLLYAGLLLITFYLMLKDRWLVAIVGNSSFANNERTGLTHGGQRIDVN